MNIKEVKCPSCSKTLWIAGDKVLIESAPKKTKMKYTKRSPYWKKFKKK